MIWKITQTRNPDWLAVIGPYDEPFIADVKTIRGAYFDGALKAWIVPSRSREALEQVIIKHSPPPMVALKSGAEGVAQVLEHAKRLGPGVDTSDITAGLELAGMTVARIRAVEVDGRLVVVAVGSKA
jgi:hypothetical protein